MLNAVAYLAREPLGDFGITTTITTIGPVINTFIIIAAVPSPSSSSLFIAGAHLQQHTHFEDVLTGLGILAGPVNLAVAR